MKLKKNKNKGLIFPKKNFQIKIQLKIFLRDKIKQQRDAILANRIKMAKNRLRTRLGLPEQEEELNKPDEQGNSIKLLS